jgi:hypothetical protein
MKAKTKIIVLGGLLIVATFGLLYHFAAKRGALRMTLEKAVPPLRVPASVEVPPLLRDLKATSIQPRKARTLGQVDIMDIPGVFTWVPFGNKINHQNLLFLEFQDQALVVDFYAVFFAEDRAYLDELALSNVSDLNSWNVSQAPHLELRIPINVNYSHGFPGLGGPELRTYDSLSGRASGSWKVAPTGADLPKKTLAGDMKLTAEGSVNIYVTVMTMGDGRDISFAFSNPPPKGGDDFFKDLWNQLKYSVAENEGRSYPYLFAVSNPAVVGPTSCDDVFSDGMLIHTLVTGSSICSTEERTRSYSEYLDGQLKGAEYDTGLINAMLNELGIGF